MLTERFYKLLSLCHCVHGDRYFTLSVRTQQVVAHDIKLRVKMWILTDWFNVPTAKCNFNCYVTPCPAAKILLIKWIEIKYCIIKRKGGLAKVWFQALFNTNQKSSLGIKISVTIGVSQDWTYFSGLHRRRIVSCIMSGFCCYALFGKPLMNMALSDGWCVKT